MPVRRSFVALALVAGALLAGGTAAVAAPASASPTASSAVEAGKRPVSRFVAWQACEAATWRWIAENAAAGTEVDTRLNRYRPGLEWRAHGRWYVQIAGTAHERVTANNRSSYCAVGGTDADPRIGAHAFPR